MKELAKKLKNFNILLVEDNDIVRQRLANTLEFYFKDVYQASNGYDGYDIFLDKKPDLCIVDIEMKNGNGVELTKRIRTVDYHTPIIILSAYSKEEYLLKLINCNINHFILKPATSKNLLEVISNSLLKDETTRIELFENLYLDFNANNLIFEDTLISLRKKEKLFLQLLHENKNKILTYEIIQEYLWSDKFMTQNALKVFIKELRAKIPIPLIENVVSEGYRIKKV